MKNLITSSCACLIAIALTTLQPAFGQNDVAQWRGPERNGIYPGKNLLDQWPGEGPALVWKFDSLGTGYSSAAVTGERVYTVGTIDSTSYVFIFDHGGKLLVRKPLGREWTANWTGIRSTPTIYGDLGYVVNGLGVLYCFSAITGDVVWSRDLLKEYDGRNFFYGFCENLVIDGNKLFCTPGGIATHVVALDRKTGDLIWKSEGTADSVTYSNSILIEKAGKLFFITQTQKSLLALNPENGKLAWKFELRPLLHPNTPIYRDGYLFVYDGEERGGIMLRINADGTAAELVWTNPGITPMQGDAVLLGDRLYSMGEKKFVCSDWITGREIYSEPAKAMIINVISAENLIYYYDFRGEFKLLRPGESGFENLGSFRVRGGSGPHCSHPVIRGGRLYIRHDNSLFVYNIAK